MSAPRRRVFLSALLIAKLVSLHHPFTHGLVLQHVAYLRRQDQGAPIIPPEELGNHLRRLGGLVFVNEVPRFGEDGELVFSWSWLKACLSANDCSGVKGSYVELVMVGRKLIYLASGQSSTPYPVYLCPRGSTASRLWH